MYGFFPMYHVFDLYHEKALRSGLIVGFQWKFAESRKPVLWEFSRNFLPRHIRDSFKKNRFRNVIILYSWNTCSHENVAASNQFKRAQKIREIDSLRCNTPAKKRSCSTCHSSCVREWYSYYRKKTGAKKQYFTMLFWKLWQSYKKYYLSEYLFRTVIIKQFSTALMLRLDLTEAAPRRENSPLVISFSWNQTLLKLQYGSRIVQRGRLPTIRKQKVRHYCSVGSFTLPGRARHQEPDNESILLFVECD